MFNRNITALQYTTQEPPEEREDQQNRRGTLLSTITEFST